MPVTWAAIPSAHTANAQAMYDYGNNTMQFLQNAMQTINTAKQYGWEQVASSLTQSTFNVVDSSAKSINEYAAKTEQDAQKHLGQTKKNNNNDSTGSTGSTGSGFTTGGGRSAGAGAGRGR